MEITRWLDILTDKRNLDPDREVAPADVRHPFYLVEGINKDTSADESFLVYDYVSLGEDATFCYKEFLAAIEKSYEPYPVVVFKNWEHERQVYWKYYSELEKAADRKDFSDWFEKKISIYIDGREKVILETDDNGINYLEYPVNSIDADKQLRGRIYNISFYEIKKLFNVTGAHLFIDNVRYGLRRHRTGETLKSKFREYLGIALYEKASELSLTSEQVEEFKEKLDIDSEFVPYMEATENREENLQLESGFLLPQNFWFYHNGISIFSYEKSLQTPANKIILCPDKVSVINGAQTLTNFFLEAESVERLLEPILEGSNVSAKTVVNSIIKKIYVKAIIINGEDRFVRPITHGLNTQIPILEETLLADSKVSDDINDLLAKSTQASNRIKILKDGEMWTGEHGLSVLEFVKHWFTIHNEPGKSKNFSKNALETKLREIKSVLESDTDSPGKIGVLAQVYQWWDSARNLRIASRGEDAVAVAIGKYGKNYFGSYVLHIARDTACLDDSSFEILYERFVADLKAVSVSDEIAISLAAFKRDDLSRALFNYLEKGELPEAERCDYPEEMAEDIKALLNSEGQSAYAFSKTIANYLLSHNVALDYFRVISRTGGKCKEAFPFPNSTFTEIIDTVGDAYKPFESSSFSAAVNREFPVFIIDKNIKATKNAVSEVHFIQHFSFAKYMGEAKRAYEQTVEAFKRGEESCFPRSSENMRFHIRPKAVNAEDTFQFTNGKHITKRTFWANRDAVETLIGEKLAESK